MERLEARRLRLRILLTSGIIAGVLLFPRGAVSQMGDGSSLNPYAGQSDPGSGSPYGTSPYGGTYDPGLGNGPPARGGYGGWGNGGGHGGDGSSGGWGGWFGGGGNNGSGGSPGQPGTTPNTSGGSGGSGNSGGSSNTGASGGCTDSPENSTLILAGLAVMTYGFQQLLRRLKVPAKSMDTLGYASSQQRYSGRGRKAVSFWAWQRSGNRRART